MTPQPEPTDFPENLQAMSARILRKSRNERSPEAEQVALHFASFAWNEAVGIKEDRESYRPIWEPTEADNPMLWDELRSNDINAMLDTMVLYKRRHFPNDRRRVLFLTFPNGNAFVEYMPEVEPGTDSQREMAVCRMIKTGQAAEAVEFLRTKYGAAHSEARSEVRHLAYCLDVEIAPLPPMPLYPPPMATIPPPPTNDGLYRYPTKREPLPPGPRPRRPSKYIPPFDDDSEIDEKLARWNHFSISRIVQGFCQCFLNEHYSVVCVRVADKLLRDHPAQLKISEPSIWAGAIIRAVRSLNQQDVLNARQEENLDGLDRFLLSRKRAIDAKMRKTLKLLKMVPGDPAWTISSLIPPTTLVWLVELDGLPVDSRRLPRKLQEEAVRLGLIPHLP